MSQDARAKFIAGNHTMHYKCMASSMASDQTQQRRGIIATKPETVKVWVYSTSTCNKIQEGT